MVRYNTNEAWVSWYNHHPQKYKPGRMFSKRKEFYLQFIASLINKPHLKVLDIGCGKGVTLQDIAISDNTHSFELYGIDLAKDVLINTKEKYEEINFICASTFNLPFKENTFDIIMCSDLLHHLAGNTRFKSKINVERAILEIKRVCNGGHIIIMEQCVKWKFSSYLVFFVSHSYSLLNIEFPFIEMHKGIVINFLTPKELYETLRRCNIEIIIQKQDEKKGKHILSPLLRATWVKLIGQGK
jgi:ubiquinone/menaquinone biosynthesis C-methylase UbiE